jgi:hypothetical protein
LLGSYFLNTYQAEAAQHEPKRPNNICPTIDFKSKDIEISNADLYTLPINSNGIIETAAPTRAKIIIDRVVDSRKYIGRKNINKNLHIK